MKRKMSFELTAVLAVLLVLIAGPAGADPKKITSAIDEASQSCRGVSQQIWEYRETGQQEFKSSALLKEELAKLGYKVSEDLKVPEDLMKEGVVKTAFKAEMTGKGSGPTVTLMLEYDALATGHACGHNLIATSGLMAAAGLAKVMKDTPGRVIVLSNPRVGAAAWTSAWVSLLSATLVTVLALLVAWTVLRSRAIGQRMRNVVDTLAFMPLAIPGTMIGMALIYVYLTLSFLAIYGTALILVAAYVTVYLSFTSRTASASLIQLHPELEEAARTCGATPATAVRRIVLPLLLPSLAGAWVWVMAHVMRELSTALLLQGEANGTICGAPFVAIEKDSQSAEALKKDIDFYAQLFPVTKELTSRTTQSSPLRGASASGGDLSARLHPPLHPLP